MGPDPWPSRLAGDLAAPPARPRLPGLVLGFWYLLPPVGALAGLAQPLGILLAPDAVCAYGHAPPSGGRGASDDTGPLVVIRHALGAGMAERSSVAVLPSASAAPWKGLAALHKSCARLSQQL